MLCPMKDAPTVCVEHKALIDGEIEEVANPEKSDGPSLIRFTVFKTTDKVTHKKKVETDKSKLDDIDDINFTFDDLDMPWTMDKSNKALQTIASIGKTKGSIGSVSMASQAVLARVARLPRAAALTRTRNHWPSRMQRKKTSSCARWRLVSKRVSTCF